MDTKQYEKLKSDTGVALVEFYASWCPHCQRMMPVVADLRDLFSGRANVYQFDIDMNQDLAEALDVQSIPTFIIYKDGQEVWRGSGEMEGSALAAHVTKALGQA